MAEQASKATSAGSEPAMRDTIIDAALDLIAQQGWPRTSARDIMRAAGVMPVQFYREFDDKYSVVTAASRRFNAAMMEAAGDFGPEESVRDRLFGIVMARFDAAEPYRPAIKAMRNALPFDPRLGALVTQNVAQGARVALEAAGVDTQGPLGMVRANAFLASVFAPALRAFLKDDTEDLSKTMAELDKRLGQAERFAGRMGPLSGAKKKDYGAKVDDSQDPGPDALKPLEPAEPQREPNKGGASADAGAPKASPSKKSGAAAKGAATKSGTGGSKTAAKPTAAKSPSSKKTGEGKTPS